MFPYNVIVQCYSFMYHTVFVSMYVRLIYEFISKTKGNVHNMYILSERQWLALGIRGMQLWHVLLFSQYGTIEKNDSREPTAKAPKGTTNS